MLAALGQPVGAGPVVTVPVFLDPNPAYIYNVGDDKWWYGIYSGHTERFSDMGITVLERQTIRFVIQFLGDKRVTLSNYASNTTHGQAEWLSLAASGDPFAGEGRTIGATSGKVSLLGVSGSPSPMPTTAWYWVSPPNPSSPFNSGSPYVGTGAYAELTASTVSFSGMVVDITMHYDALAGSLVGPVHTLSALILGGQTIAISTPTSVSADVTNYSARLVSGSPSSLSQRVYIGQDPFALSFDYRFESPLGDLTVALGSQTLMSMDAGTAGPGWQTATIPVDSAALNGPLDLVFTVDGIAGSTVLLDNVTMPGISNGGFQTGDLTGWIGVSSGSGSVLAMAIPEPASLGVLALGVLALLRRRS